MTLLLDGLEVTDLRWYVGYNDGTWAKYTCVNRHGYGVGGTISQAEWLRRSVETDDHGQALLASPDGTSFADSPAMVLAPAADNSAHSRDGGGVLSTQED